MPVKLKPALLASVVALLAFPSAAQGILAYVKNPQRPVVYAASGDGSHISKFRSGSNPYVFLGGSSVAYLHEGRSGPPELRVVIGGRSEPRTLMTGWREPEQIDFHEELIALLRGPEVGRRELVVLDLESDTQRVLDRGYFSGLSFCPNCAEPQLVYSKSPREGFPLRSDVYRVTVDGGAPVPLTKDHRSLSPLWGQSTLERAQPGRIVFVKQLGAKRRQYGPKNELFLMNANGGQVERLTHTRVGPLAEGLFPVEWSSDGRRLLTAFEGQDLNYAVAVYPRTGAQRPIGAVGEQGFVGTDLSGSGETVLGYTGGFDPSSRHDVVAIPFDGGRARIKVRNAYEPSWTR